jgi:NTE family protein
MSPSSKSGQQPTASVIIGAGAPHASLLAGALTEVYLAGKTFTNVYTSGSGALVGLLYCAPRGVEAPAALEALGTAGVSDAIYKVFPLAYKVFFKRGPFTEAFYRAGAMLQSKRAPRLYNDLVGLMASALTPSTLTIRTDDDELRAQLRGDVRQLVPRRATPHEGVDPHATIDA